MKAQLLTELPYHRIETSAPRKPPNKYVEFFGSYIALPLMSIILVLSLLILFLLVKTYFSNSYMYALQDSLVADGKQSNIGAIIDSRYDQFNNNRKQGQQFAAVASVQSRSSLLERMVDRSRVDNNNNGSGSGGNSDNGQDVPKTN